jgi:hypothetical protein
LEVIEAAVQARAKDIVLDMGTAEAAARLRALIYDEVRRWSDDFRRGRRDFDLAQPEVVAERSFRNLAGYGPLEPLLRDDDVWEIMINGPEETLADVWGRAPSEDEVTIYWASVVAANRSRLADPTNPDLVFSGEIVVLPPVPQPATPTAAEG